MAFSFYCSYLDAIKKLKKLDESQLCKSAFINCSYSNLIKDSKCKAALKENMDIMKFEAHNVNYL